MIALAVDQNSMASLVLRKVECEGVGIALHRRLSDAMGERVDGVPTVLWLERDDQPLVRRRMAQEGLWAPHELWVVPKLRACWQPPLAAAAGVPERSSDSPSETLGSQSPRAGRCCGGEALSARLLFLGGHSSVRDNPHSGC